MLQRAEAQMFMKPYHHFFMQSDRGMLRGSWQQKGGVPGSVVKLSINGMQEHHGVSLPEASSMLSVRSNHSGRSGHSVRSCHSHSDTSSQKTVVEVAMVTIMCSQPCVCV